MKALLQAPALQTPIGRTGICTVAVSLLAGATHNLLFALDQPHTSEALLGRVILTGLAFATGTTLIYLGHCHALLPTPRRRKRPA